MEKEIKGNPMGYENILSLIIKMSLPAMLSMLIQSLYNITDSYFVAQYSEKALRATSLSYPIQIIIVGFGVGTGVGINSFISRAFGSNKNEEANQGVMNGFFLVLASWLLFLIFRFTMMENFIYRFTTDLEVVEMSKQYLGLVTTFSIFSLIQISIEKTIQGTGNMIAPMIIQLLGAIVNIILDPIMIFGLFGFPKMGIRGAAIATLIGQASAAGVGLFMLLARKTIIEINLSKFKFSLDILKNIYRVGVPSIFMQSVKALVTTIMNLIIVKHSELGVSVLGIYLKLESFIWMPVFGLSQGVMPIMGYNYGARKKDRIKKTLRYGTIFAVIIMLLGTILFQTLPEKLISIFNSDEEMISMGVYTLRIISIGYVFAGVSIISSTLFQALGLGKSSFIITLLREVVIVIPLAYFLSSFGINYLWIAYPVSEFVGFLAALYINKKVKKTYLETL